MQSIAIKKIEENKQIQSPILDLSYCNLGYLRESILSLPWLEELDLRGNSLKNLDGLSSLIYLKKINLQENQLVDISGLSGITGLEYLKLNNNYLANLNGLSTIPNLKKLDLQNNQLTDVSSLSDVLKLEELNLSGNRLINLDCLSTLTHLKKLNLQFNILAYANFLSGMLNLEEVILNNNKFVNLNGLSPLPKLKNLQIRGNQLVDIENLSGMLELENLDLSFNMLTNLDSLSSLPNLKKIYLRNNKLVDIRGLSKMLALEEVVLTSNKLTNLNGLSALPYLKRIELEWNHLVDISNLSEMLELEDLNLNYNRLLNLKGFAKLPKLKIIYLKFNQLVDVINLSEMHALEVLDLSDNSVSSFQKIPVLPNLKELDLRNNKIKSIYVHLLENFPSLKKINLKGNKIKELPLEIKEKLDNLNTIKNYLSSLQKGIANNNEVKLIIAGNSTAGKTTLIHFLQNYEYNDKQNSTHGISLSRWNIGSTDNPLQINVWDFGGQEYYHSTHRLFLDDSALYLLLWDSFTNVQKLQETELYQSDQYYNLSIEHFHYSYWLDLIRYYAPRSPIMMIQTKTEKAGEQAVEKEYFYKPYNVYMPSYHLSIKKAFEYLEDDSKTQWIEYKAFETRLVKVLQQEASKYLLGVKWIEVRDKIREISKDHPWMHLEEFENICYGIDSDIEIKELMSYLSGSSSTILYYEQHTKLKDIVFLNPQWVTDTIYDILSYEIQEKHKGEFTFQHIKKILKQKGLESIVDKFLELMKAYQFELIFEKPNCPNTYIAPQYLPETYYDEKGFRKLIPKSSIGFTLYFPRYMPKSIFIRFMVRYGDLAEDIYWKYGIVLDKNDTRIVAECLFSERKIRITIEDKPFSKYLGYELFQVLWELSDQKSEIELSIDEVDFVKIGKLQNQLENSKNVEIESEQGNYVSIDTLSYLFTDERAQNNIKRNQMTTTINPEIFVSYAWEPDSEKIVDKFSDACKIKGFHLVRDKKDIYFKGFISEFMSTLGKGNFVLIVISDKYLKSENCMFELLEIVKNGNLYNRIFPIVTRSTNFYKPIGRVNYIKYWENEIKELNNAMKDLESLADLKDIRESIDLYTKIRRTISDLISILKDMNSLTIEQHLDTNFEDIFNLIERDFIK